MILWLQNGTENVWESKGFAYSSPSFQACPWIWTKNFFSFIAGYQMLPYFFPRALWLLSQLILQRIWKKLTAVTLNETNYFKLATLNACIFRGKVKKFFKGESTQNRWVLMDDFSKGGVHETDGFWWVIFQRGEYTKSMAFDGFGMFFLSLLKIKRPGCIFSANTVNDIFNYFESSELLVIERN